MIDVPARRMDLALPDRSPVAELLPGLVRRAGAALADEGVHDGGWMPRRPDRTPVMEASTLGAQRVRDGEVLHLVPRGTDRPEPEYDDLAATVTAGAARTGRLWASRHTRALGLAGAGAAAGSAAHAGAGPGGGGRGRGADAGRRAALRPAVSAAARTAGGGVGLRAAGTVQTRARGVSGARTARAS
ncbi:EsaB/YukD family protein, partial [Amycolatopsis sp. NPDC051373]|uniref:EsaB/YukD family protein n=1 Tax=Amycolatopsis sp. NPDC051373 TaxID=3155801 RepID=UPI00344B4669